MASPKHATQGTRRREVSPGLVLLGVGVLGVVLVAGLGSIDPIGAITVAVLATIQSGLPAALYVLGAWGLGGIARAGFSRSPEASAIQLGVGLGLMLSISHGLGVLGVLNPATAIGTVGIGLVLGLVQVLRSEALRSGQARAPMTWSSVGPAMSWLPAMSLLLVASASPPGWLWASEFGGYDALSYHLQLPQEWIAAGQIKPVSHNVYSYLPSYVESAYVHLAHLTLAPSDIGSDEMQGGLLGGTGWRALIPHYLHAMLAIASAWLVRRLTICLLVERCESDEARNRLDTLAWFAGALVLSTPWVIVVGSLAYNEMAVVALATAAIIVAISPGLHPLARGVLIGWIVGVACGAKPTALFLVGGPVGVVLVGSWFLGRWSQGRGSGVEGREGESRSVGMLGVVMCVGCVAGLVALSPWLIRNAMSGGNPVFPHLTGVFGEAHWSSEQVARYAGAHRFDGSILDRLALAALPEQGSYRGMSHPQWLAFWGVALFGIVVAMLRRETRRAGVLVAVALVGGLASWLAFTHIQSRFLLPLIPPAMLAVVLGAWSLHADRRIGARVLLGAVVLQAMASGFIFFTQRDGAPNLLTSVGPGYFSGDHARLLLGETPQRERADRLRGLEELGQVPPSAWMNLMLEPGEVVYMIGDATPFYIRPPVLYHTTWDTSPLGTLIRESPDDPDAWTRGLRRSGVRYVDISFGELDRLSRDGWYDPIVTPELVDEWAQTLGRPVRRWPEIGRVVFDLQRADTP